VKLHVIETGFFKLDGGAMFGVVPKSLWNKVYPADTQNLCTWSMRCLLIEYPDRLVLIDTGIGNKQSDKFFAHYHLHGPHSLALSLKKTGFSPADVTDVFLTHLHFDHCGGALLFDSSRNVALPAFPNALYYTHPLHWQWATRPNAREKASFLKENILPLSESGQLKFVEGSGEFTPEIFPGFKARIVNGHTEAQMIPYIQFEDKTLIYCADLLPSHAHIPLPWVMGYDTRPLLTLKEKETFLADAADHRHLLFFEHDAYRQTALVSRTERGISLLEAGNLSDFI
jgi:glyoxylase-like metal-dependent hydrolase (beta-lactamase superfamily II)